MRRRSGVRAFNYTMMSETLTQRNPFTIEQAGNFLKELGKKLVHRIKKARAEDGQISTALPHDRIKYLSYAISFLKDVIPEHAALFYRVTGKSHNLYSSTEIADMFRKILTVRTRGGSIILLAYVLKIDVETMNKVEQIAILAASEAIGKAQVGAIPLVGG